MSTVSISDSESEPLSREVGTIYCVGQNYLKHIQEMQGKIPDAPVIFTKPPSALVHSNTMLQFPIEKGMIHHEVEVVMLIGKSGRRIDKREAWNYVEAYGLGIDFTLRELQTNLRERGLPWLLSKGFDHSAAVTSFLPVPDYPEFQNIRFFLDLNEKRQQDGEVNDMVFDVPTILTFLSRTITLKKGDLIFTGTPSGVGRVRSGDTVTIGINGTIEETFTVQ